MNPVQAFELFVKDGRMQELKGREKFVKAAKLALKSELEMMEGKRHEFKSINMVAKFVTKEVREVNHSGLITDLLDYRRVETLAPIVTLNMDLIKADELVTELNKYQLPPTYYVKYTLNKKGKLFLKEEDYLFGGQTPLELAAEIRAINEEIRAIDGELQAIKDSLHNYPALQKDKKIPTEIGSISYIANKPKWDMEQIAFVFGEEFLVRYGTVLISELDNWILRGDIPKEILTKNRKVVDIRFDFIIMDLEDEAKALNFYHNQRSKISRRLA